MGALKATRICCREMVVEASKRFALDPALPDSILLLIFGADITTRSYPISMAPWHRSTTTIPSSTTNWFSIFLNVFVERDRSDKRWQQCAHNNNTAPFPRAAATRLTNGDSAPNARNSPSLGLFRFIFGLSREFQLKACSVRNGT